MSARGTGELTSANSEFNAQQFLIEQWVLTNVNTAAPCRVEAVNTDNQTVTVLPLVDSVDADGNAVTPVPVYNVPYRRLQGGVAAIIIDPVIGDIGLAVFCQRDISSVKVNRGPANPGSFRFYDQADAIYIGGFLNREPSIFLELMQDNTARLIAPTKVLIETPECKITGNLIVGGTAEIAGDTTMQANAEVALDLTVGGNVSWLGTSTGASGGPAVFSNGVSVTGGDVVAGAISLQNHVHGGVLPGGADTEGPK